MLINLKSFVLATFLIAFLNVYAQQSLPKIISSTQTSQINYLPDYSYAGYKNGEEDPSTNGYKIYYATDFGVIANDNLDDSKALLKALKELKNLSEKTILQLPAGRVILSEILYIQRSNFVLRGAGSDMGGTEIYCPRPMMYLKDPEILKELREYLLEFDKRQIEKENNIDLPFSQYAWSGGMIWTHYPGERIKSYLKKYEVPANEKAKIISGNRGEKEFIVESANNLKIGDVLQLELFNTQGKSGAIIEELYQNAEVKVGSHHWEFPDLPIVRQQVEIMDIKKNQIRIKTPLTINIKKEFNGRLIEWKHLKEVGFEDFKFTFPKSPRIAHHVEQGYNALFLTRLYNGWVKNIVIDNADSGILTEEIANITIDKVRCSGENTAHYSVAMAGVHNVLAKRISVSQAVVHPLSFNTFSTKNVYQNCEIFTHSILDQHSGANHQNLFDQIKVHLRIKEDGTYPLFEGGGAGYWKPSHGAFTTFWNIEVNASGNWPETKPITLNGMKDGTDVRLIGVYGNRDLQIDYSPNPYIELLNKKPKEIPSLYDYQLKMRTGKN